MLDKYVSDGIGYSPGYGGHCCGCRCMAREFTGAITEADAQALIRSAGNPPEGVKQRITRAAVQAGFKCASQLRPRQQN